MLYNTTKEILLDIPITNTNDKRNKVAVYILDLKNDDYTTSGNVIAIKNEMLNEVKYMYLFENTNIYFRFKGLYSFLDKIEDKDYDIWEDLKLIDFIPNTKEELLSQIKKENKFRKKMV